MMLEHGLPRQYLHVPRHFFGFLVHVSFLLPKAFCPLWFYLQIQAPPRLASQKHASFGQQWPKFWLSDWKLLLSILIHCWVGFRIQADHLPLRAQWDTGKLGPKLLNRFYTSQVMQVNVQLEETRLETSCCSTVFLTSTKRIKGDTLSWSLFRFLHVFALMPLAAFLSHSYVIICHHMSSYVIICHHMSSYVIICHHMSSYVIICHHMSSYVIICHHMSSYVIICHLMSSYIICHILSYHTQFCCARTVLWCQRTLHAMGLWPSPRSGS